MDPYLIFRLLLLCVIGTTVLNASDMLAEYTFDADSAAATNMVDQVLMVDWDMTASIANGEDSSIRSGKARIGGEFTPTNNNINPSAPKSYHQFSFTVQNLGVGQTLSVSNIKGHFSGNLHPGDGSTAGHRVALFSDAVGYYDNSDRIGDEVWIDNHNDSERPSSISFDISTIDITNLNNLSNDDSVEFRFYFSDSTANNSYYSELDDIQLYGIIHSAVPEPASCALVTALVAAVMLGCRRPRAAFA